LPTNNFFFAGCLPKMLIFFSALMLENQLFKCNYRGENKIYGLSTTTQIVRWRDPDPNTNVIIKLGNEMDHFVDQNLMGKEEETIPTIT
jgi:hypothetical protein